MARLGADEGRMPAACWGFAGVEMIASSMFNLYAGMEQ